MLAWRVTAIHGGMTKGGHPRGNKEADAPPQETLPLNGPRRSALFLTLLFVFIACFVVTRFRGNALADPWIPILLAFIFLGVPIKAAKHFPDGLHHFGLALGGLLEPLRDAQGRPLPLRRTLVRGLPLALRELLVAIACAALLFPPYALLYYVWHTQVADVPIAAFAWTLPAGMVGFLWAQAVVIAVPEEAFFRGYVQTLLMPEQRSPKPARWTQWPPPLVWRAIALQALCFGLLHALVDLNPARMVVAFPGMLFGWLRWTRGGIGASVWLHVLSNGFAALLFENWHRS